ncbi:PH domain-containing protein [Niallia sp. 01092]|uniref:PH domain-containing protein n=1 Tax=unclassified Niallia TaxID=2837522 RepID=UPI003FD699F2
MYSTIPVPTKRIAADAIKVWRVTEFITTIVILLVLGVLYYLGVYFSWENWIGWIIIALIILTILSSIWGILVEPALKQKYWRYDVSEEFIQLKSGVWNEKHQLIPMTKVQSVELNQGPFLRKYQLYSISIGTMGSSHEIPAVSKEEAYQLRDQIAYYAKIKEVE